MKTRPARRTDPATSKTPGFDESKLRASQRRVLQALRVYGAMDDKALLVTVNDMEKQLGLRPMSPSGARSRRSELSRLNDERLRELERDYLRGRETPTNTEYAAAEEWARRSLKIEGYRSPIVDSGRRVKYEGGYSAIVWEAVNPGTPPTGQGVSND